MRLEIRKKTTIVDDTVWYSVHLDETYVKGYTLLSDAINLYEFIKQEKGKLERIEVLKSESIETD